jgi:hypothetical protein
MNLMLDLDDDEETWVRGDYNTDQLMEDENAAVGEEAIERVAAGLGGKALGPYVVALVQEYAASENSSHRRAAVAALSRLAEGSSKVILKSKKTFTKNILNFFCRCFKKAILVRHISF